MLRHNLDSILKVLDNAFRQNALYQIQERNGQLMTTYKPLKERKPDLQYRHLLWLIKEKGEVVETQQEHPALCLFGHQMRFRLDNGFPIITERDLVSGTKSIFHQSLGELFAFLHGARTQQELEEFGCFWWKDWVTPEKCAKRGLEPGDLGDGSYGAAWAHFPTKDGGEFNQIQHLVEQIKELPHLRTHFVSSWIPQYNGRGQEKIQKVVVVPCHGWFHVRINPATHELSLHHFQRSADVPVGLTCNLIEYAALTLMLAQVAGYKAKELVYTLSDAHIYFGQMNDVDDMLATEPQLLPTVMVNPEVKNLLDFRQKDFLVQDYQPQLLRRRIWTPI